MRLLRRIVDRSSLLLGRIKRRRRIVLPTSNEPVKVNMGCGLAVAPGWLNIDGSLNALVAAMPRCFHGCFYRFTGSKGYYSKDAYLRLLGGHRFVHHDLTYGLPLADRIADYLYSSHFIEHLFQKDAEYLLREAYRVLKPGGVIRISVPALEFAISLYREGEKKKMLSRYFFVETDDSYYARHRYMYDFDMLSRVLGDAGSTDVQRCEFRKGQTPDIEILDNYADESLFIEARR